MNADRNIFVVTQRDGTLYDSFTNKDTAQAKADDLNKNRFMYIVVEYAPVTQKEQEPTK